MKVYKWDEIEKEEMNELLARRCINGDRMTLAMIYLKKGCVVPLHSHENEQMSTVFKGALKFLIDGKEIVVGPGETLRIPPMMPHSAIAIEDCEEMDVFATVLQTDLLEITLRSGVAKRADPSAETSTRIEDIEARLNAIDDWLAEFEQQNKKRA